MAVVAEPSAEETGDDGAGLAVLCSTTDGIMDCGFEGAGEWEW